MSQNRPLPDGFPGRKELEAANFTSLDDVRSMSEEQLTEIDGIGPKTAASIVAAVKQITDEGTDATPARSGQSAGQAVISVATRPPALPQFATRPEAVEVVVGTERGPRGTLSTTIDPA